ncbi:hypothetical protein ACGF0J_35130 [Nonomuraea sp. NPDC047897]|uniref:ABC transporter substrate-binding protein n=1 Tax=Nonomuraea sp. NPDC047897 TaxID=3364346 RepID=UPI003719F708
MPHSDVYQVIDRVVRRPWPLARERELPILVFTGGAAAEAAEKARLFRHRAPFAEISASGTSVVSIVRQLAGADEDHSLTKWNKDTLLPPPRFPLTQFVLWAWTQRTGDAAPPRAVLKPALATWRRSRAATARGLAATIDYLGRAMTTWIPASGLAAYGLQKLVDGLSLALLSAVVAATLLVALVHAVGLIRGPLFYRWYKKAPTLPRRRGDDIIRYAQRLCEAPPEEVERLLVTALLEDLRQAYQRRVLPWPGWGRDTYPVVLLNDADPVTGSRRCMELVHDVRVSDGQRGPLLLVVSTGVPPGGRSARPVRGEVADSRRLVRQWRERARRARPSPYLVIEVDAPPLSDREFWPLPLRPLAFWVVVFALIAGPVAGAAAAASGCGTALESVAGQCVGLGPPDRMALHPLVEKVVGRIEEQNGQVPLAAKVFTVAYLGPLTTEPGAKFKDGQMSAVAGELTGIGAYQDSYNRSKSDWKLRIVFANTGQDFLSAERAALAVAERARTDPSLAAVVGFAWSREEVRRAVATLTGANLPMVSTVSTVDQIAAVGSGRSAYLFRLAVVDRLQISATVHWLTTIGLAGDVGRRPPVAVVWQRQPGELYSQDLKELFLRAYPGTRSEHAFTDDASLGAAMEAACASGAKVVYYTGRADFLSGLKRAWGASCEKRRVRLLVSDDLTGAIANEVGSDESGHDVSMSFVSLTDVRDTSPNQAQRTIRQWAGKTSAYSSAHASFGYDAVQAVAIAFDDYRTQGGAGDISSGVHYNLRGLGFEGATGTVTFSGHATDHDAQGREVWLMSVESGRPISAVRMCRPTDKGAGCDSPPG